MHYCSTEYGSSGSPILNVLNNKVIGIHKKGGTTKEYNVGLFLYEPIKIFINKYNNKIKEKNDKIIDKKIIKKLNEFGEQEKILKDLFINLFNKRLISDIVQINSGGQIALIYGYQLLCSQEFLPKNYSTINEKWIPAYHGTSYKNLESIIKYGFKLPGSKLKDGSITPLPKVIPKTEKVSGIKNWEKAIFASPSMFGASRYSSPIGICKYYCLIEVMIKPNSFTEHQRVFIVKFDQFDCMTLDKFHVTSHMNYKIYRISSEENIVLKSIIFINQSYLNFFEKKSIEIKERY